MLSLALGLPFGCRTIAPNFVLIAGLSPEIAHYGAPSVQSTCAILLLQFVARFTVLFLNFATLLYSLNQNAPKLICLLHKNHAKSVFS